MTRIPTATRWKAMEQTTTALMREVDELKRNLGEAKEKARQEQEQVLLELLEVVDGFERVFGNVEPRLEGADRQARIWVGNFRSVRRVFENILKAQGVAAMEAVGQIAVPGLHTIVETRENAEVEEGTIVEETQRGYVWRGAVLRKALVIAIKH